jgi:glycosyltransferase involved in cell wall biosynthesis
MRIAFYSDNFYPEISGISDSIITLGKELARRGHDIHYFAPRYTEANHKKVGLPYKEADLGPNITIHRFASLPFPTATGQGRMVIPFGRIREVRKINPDVIHSQLPFGVGIEALIAAKKLKKPFVGTNHTPMTEFTRYSPIRNRFIDAAVMKYTVWYYNRATYVTSPCNAIFTEMNEYGFTAPHHAMSNPLEIDIFKPVQDKTPFKKKFNLSEFTVLYAGRLAVEKKIDLTLEAVARAVPEVPNINFAIVGKGPAEAGLRARARELGIEARVKFLGFMEHFHALSEVYNASDLFVIMSTAETQSLVAMNALSSGIPAIVANSWGLPEYVDNTRGAVVEPGDVSALTEKIIDFYKHPAKRKKLGAVGRVFTEERSIPRIADQWEEIYTNAIKTHTI